MRASKTKTEIRQEQIAEAALALLSRRGLRKMNVAIPRLIFSEEIFSGHARQRQRMYQLFQSCLKEVQKLIREGQLQGAIRPDLPPSTGSVMFLGLVQPAIILSLLSDGAFDMAAHAERAWGLFGGMLQVGSNGGKTRARSAAGHPWAPGNRSIAI